MSRFSYQEQVATSASVDESLDAVRGALADLGAGPKVVDGVVVGSLGSQWKVRLFGLTFGSPSWMPVKITAEPIDQGPDRLIRFDVAEDFGFGSLAGVEGRSRARCQEVLAQVVKGVASRLPSESPTSVTRH